MTDKEDLWNDAFALAREAESDASELREKLGQTHATELLTTDLRRIIGRLETIRKSLVELNRIV